VDLTVTPTSRIAVVGENGRGKSTLLHILSGALPPDEGQVSRIGTLGIAEQEMSTTDRRTVGQVVADAIADSLTALTNSTPPAWPSPRAKTGPGLVSHSLSNRQRPSTPGTLAAGSTSPSRPWMPSPIIHDRSRRCPSDIGIGSDWPASSAATPISCCSTNRPITSI